MSSLYPRGPVWWLQWTDVDGRSHRRTTGIRVETDPEGEVARQVQRDLDSRLARKHAGLEDDRPTIAEAVSRWLASIGDASDRWREECQVRANRLTGWLDARGIRHLPDITPEALQDYAEERRRSVGAKTLRTELDQIRAVAKLANRSRRISPIPVDTWPTVRRVTAARPDRIGAYTHDEVRAIIEDLQKWKRRQQWVVPVQCLAFLGCRWGELAALRVGDIDLTARPPVVRIECHKTARTVAGQHRWVEIHPDLVPVLRPLVVGRPGGQPLISDLPDIHNGRNVIGRCCERLGIQFRRLHGFRHYWVSSMLRAGTPVALVMQMAGHRNIGTTQGYLTLPEISTGWVTGAFPTAKIDPESQCKPAVCKFVPKGR